MSPIIEGVWVLVSHFSGGKKIILVGVLVLVMLTGLHLSAGDLYGITPLASATRDLLAPVQRLAMVAGREVSELFSFPVSIINISQRNKMLSEKVSELEGELLKLQEAREENARLKDLLDFQTQIATQMTTETAAVIGRDTGNWFGSIIINKGLDNGIEADMAVITPAGLVGRVTKVSGTTAEVLLITDPRSGVGCLVHEKRAPGIVEGLAGGSGNLQMVHIPADLAPQQGDKIISSGLGSVYPKGIPVGTVVEKRKEKSGLFIMADITPYVDFNRLEEVLVIKSVNPVGE